MWKKFAEACHELKDDFYILGEVWHSSQSWLQGDEFTAVMNYSFTESITNYFLEHTISLEKFVSNLNEQLTLYRKQTNQMMLNTIDTHDTPRLLTLADGNKDLMKQVLAFLYLQQGVPCLYYGDEIGMDGGMDPDCRKCMVWEPEKQDRNMFAFMKQLIAFRLENQFTLSEGTLAWLKIDPDNGTLIFERSTPEEYLIGIFNTGDQPIQEDLSGEVSFVHLANIQKNQLTIKPKGFVIVKK